MTLNTQVNLSGKYALYQKNKRLLIYPKYAHTSINLEMFELSLVLK